MVGGPMNAMLRALCTLPAVNRDPGIGPVTALSFSSAIEDPTRLRRSRDVAA
jgi:transposase